MRRVVITGLGAISPVGLSAEEMFQSLTAGKNGIGLITRFDTEGFEVKIAAEVKGFDPVPWMGKEMARKADPFMAYAYVAALQAMQDSGLEGKIAPERLGVYVGSGIGGMVTLVNETKKLLERGPSRVSPFFIPTMIANIATGNIAIRFKAMGPTLPVTTACATGSNAVGEAYRAIAFGFADAILAGGSEATITPLAVAGFTNCMALTRRNDPQTACLPFDKRRDGFVMGEGSGILVLEELEHAQKRGARIYAEIVGYGNSCDAHHVTAPDESAQAPAAAIRQALEQGGYAKGEKLYINAHGTSTPLNDKTETKAIKLALGEEAKKAQISSTKSMTGHMLGAAGAVEAVVCALALDKGVLPPTIGLQEADPDCDLDYIPGRAREDKADLALSTSLGFGGHNACLAFRPYKEGA